MKKLNLFLMAIVLISLSASSCKKSAQIKPAAIGALGNTYPTILNSIVTPKMIDTLRSHGLVINDGTTPPTVNGVYYLSPDECTYDNAGPNAGKIFSGYQYQFINQDNSKYTVTVNYSNAIVGGGDAVTDGSATYISGNGSLFTVYVEVTGTLSGVTYKELQLLSGQLQSGSIKNLQWAFLMVSKSSDPGDKAVVPVGTIRIFKDQDGTSELQNIVTLNSITPNLNSSKSGQEFKSLVVSLIKN